MPEVGVVGYVYNFQDLTEEKRREAEYRTKDRMATLGRMAAGIAHEIRNPLASIAGSVKLLQSISELDDDQAKLITIVSRESERLNKLVSDFLLYSRDQRFEFQPVDVVTLLEETLLMVEHHPLFGPQIHIERKFPRRGDDPFGGRRQAPAGLLEYLRQLPEGHAQRGNAHRPGGRSRASEFAWCWRTPASALPVYNWRKSLNRFNRVSMRGRAWDWRWSTRSSRDIRGPSRWIRSREKGRDL